MNEKECHKCAKTFELDANKKCVKGKPNSMIWIYIIVGIVLLILIALVVIYCVFMNKGAEKLPAEDKHLADEPAQKLDDKYAYDDQDADDEY